MIGLIKDTNSIMSSETIKQPVNESITLTGYLSKDGNSFVKFKNILENSSSSFISVDNSGNFTKYTVLKKCKIFVTGSCDYTSTGSFYTIVRRYNSSNINVETSINNVSNSSASSGIGSLVCDCNVGDYFVVICTATPTDAANTNFNIVATAIENITTNLVLNVAPASAEMDYAIDCINNDGQVITANVTNIPFKTAIQSNLNWNGDSFIAPVDGNYEISGMIYQSVNTASIIAAYINDVAYRAIGGAGANNNIPFFSGKIKLLAGQKLSLRSSLTCTLLNSVTAHWLSITRLNGKLAKTVIGNVALDYNYDISSFISATNSTINSATATVKKLASGFYEVDLLIETTATTALSSIAMAITGILSLNRTFPALVVPAFTGYSPSYTITANFVANSNSFYAAVKSSDSAIPIGTKLVSSAKIITATKPTWAIYSL